MSTWMVVEDEPDIYDVLLAMFEVWGIDGETFVDGDDAVAWIEDVEAGRMPEDKPLPELAIIDVRLPEVPGQQVSARLRQSPIFKNIAIVLVTAYILHAQEEEEIMAESGADMIMYKPLPGPTEFRQNLEEVLAKRKAMVQESEESAAVVDSDELPEAAATVKPDTIDEASSGPEATAGEIAQSPEDRESEPKDEPSFDFFEIDEEDLLDTEELLAILESMVEPVGQDDGGPTTTEHRPGRSESDGAVFTPRAGTAANGRGQAVNVEPESEDN